ncbi:MAG: formate--tetrahydrofolate ligase [Clostridia bacterium]|nr:formate--tetrahydrofolate ligase [Clostridia bacterium]
MKPIMDIGEEAGFLAESLIPYGKWIAKVDPEPYASLPGKGKLILVTAMNPTPAGEGKTTVSVGLADGLAATGRKTMLALREPSLGPVFGVKGGAAGGGYAQVLPMESINLHFTGDLHAITSANNLLAAMVDNHIQQGNPLNIDPRRVSFRRCMDINDRQLRQMITGLGGKGNGYPREDGFDITAASEVMACFCLSSDIRDLQERLARIIVARDRSGKAVTAGDLQAQGAMTALLRDAIKPNLIQTLGGTPCLMHGGPFANIAHGCNSVIATQTALKMADYVVTEAGFGADLGAEKFIDIKCRMSGLWPDAVVLVATVRALKAHGGIPKAALSEQNVPALQKGLHNLYAHLHNIRHIWNLPCVVAVNRFSSDTDAELDALFEGCRDKVTPAAICDGWALGGKGVTALADLAAEAANGRTEPCYTYPGDIPLREKIEAVARRVYGADGVIYGNGVLKDLSRLEEDGMRGFPVCIAKTQYSLSDNPSLTGRPSGFSLHIRQVRPSASAGFVVAFAGDIIAMPGLPKVPAAQSIGVNENGRITGLF